MEQLHFNNLFKVDSKYGVLSGGARRIYKCAAVTKQWAVMVDELHEVCIVLNRYSAVSDLMKFKPI